MTMTKTSDGYFITKFLIMIIWFLVNILEYFNALVVKTPLVEDLTVELDDNVEFIQSLRIK